MSLLRFGCPKCRQVLQVNEDRATTLVECPRCRTHLRVPAAVTAPLAAPPPDPQSLLDDWLDRWEDDGLNASDPETLERFVRQHCQGAAGHLVEEFRTRVRALAVMDARLRTTPEAASPMRQTSDEQDGEVSSDSPLAPGVEIIPGYRLERRLGRGAYGQVWRASGPGGFAAALKVVPLTEEHGEVEERALEIMKRLRHPHLLAVFGAWKQARRLVIGMELAERTLHDRLREAQAQGYTGIPRAELLVYMAEAAKGLDYLNQTRPELGSQAAAGIQHSDVKPQNLLLLGGGIKVGDFGLVQCLRHTVTAHGGAMTHAYAAPEFFKGETSRHSDQYSLAVAYCELRGGALPFTGIYGQLMYGHLELPPDLSMLPPEERPVLERALAKPHRDRWPSCTAFVEALRLAAAATPDVPAPEAAPALTAAPAPEAAPPAAPAPEPASASAAAPPQRRLLGRLWAAVSTPWRLVFRRRGRG